VPVPLAPSGSDWVALGPDALPVDAATAWASVPHDGAVVVFLGIVRDHADGRDGVTALTYEAYESEAARVMGEIVAAARARWSDLARVALLHRTGRLGLGESSVAVVVSSPHRATAFVAARFCIDTLTETVPIWKQEHHAGGADWGLGATEVRPLVAEDRS
jgi:molybdopterin synthase catalytic subunit